EARAGGRARKAETAKTNDAAKPLEVPREDRDAHRESATKRSHNPSKTVPAAIRAERALRYTEPPAYPRPVAEALGPMALAQGKLRIAEEAFRQGLEQYPESRRSTEGLAETLRRASRPVAAGL